METTASERLFSDSIRARTRRETESRLSRAANEEGEWVRRLSASHLLSCPSAKPPSRPFTSQGTHTEDPDTSKPRGGCFDIRFTPGTGFTSLRGRTLPQRHEQSSFTKPSLPKRVRPRRAETRSGSRLAEVSTGVQSYALPMLKPTGKERLVACRSAITAFYDAQGTY